MNPLKILGLSESGVGICRNRTSQAGGLFRTVLCDLEHRGMYEDLFLVQQRPHLRAQGVGGKRFPQQRRPVADVAVLRDHVTGVA
jgi:hypothetical protein